MQALMTMSLHAILAELFELDPDEFQPEMRLVADLGMDAQRQARLAELVAEYFDGRQVLFTPAMTVADLIAMVVAEEFAGLPGYR
jgi:hypothetical protein